MARYREPVLKRCRYLGISPTVLGMDKESHRKQAGAKHNKKVSEYAVQLKEKQKLKFVYGVGERQFRKYFDMASNTKGKTGEVLLQILESRLDNVVFRLGFAKTRPQARMLVTHGTFEVNGHKVDIPSYLIKAGDVISVREIRKDNGAIKQSIEENAGRLVPQWLEKDVEKLSGKVVRLSSREEIDIPVEEHLIVELYSK
ncbi:MAG: 30S ribosomal protein S4 [Clostridia bacterium]|nr:30S ribosomal protein S4 [Clostridia bacterium]